MIEIFKAVTELVKSDFKNLRRSDVATCKAELDKKRMLRKLVIFEDFMLPGAL